MNKKTYLKPAVEQFDAETEQMLATSVTLYNEDATGEALAPTFDIFEEE
jgi:hypothetical protein